MTPEATALTRTPRDAYSVASARVTAASPPFVRRALSTCKGERICGQVLRRRSAEGSSRRRLR